MKSLTIKFHFDDEFYEELNELAEKLNISIAQLISEFFQEGVASSWDAFEHEVKQKCEDDYLRRQKVKLVRKQKKKSE